MKVRFTFFGNLDVGDRFKDRYGRLYTKIEKIPNVEYGAGLANAKCDEALYPRGDKLACFGFDAIMELIE